VEHAAMTVVLLVAAAVALQVAAGVVRVRGWFHCVRASAPSCATVRFRDVVIAHLGSSGWNGVLPARGGEAVKVALLRRRLPSTPIGTLAGTLVPTSLVETAFTFTLVSGLLAVGVASPAAVAGRLPTDARVPMLLVAAAGVLVALWVLRRRASGLLREIGSGLAVLRRPRVLFTRVIPWQLASRVVRLVALAALLAAGGFALAPGVVLLLMAVQGATPSVGPASAAVRVAIVTAALPAAHDGIDVAHAAQVLMAGMLVSSVVNLVISAVVLALILRTSSPRRMVCYLRAVWRRDAGTDDSRSQAPRTPFVAKSGLPPMPRDSS